MNLYIISQDVNNEYDTFDSAVVAAESEEEARFIHPHKDNFSAVYKSVEWDGVLEEYDYTWCNAKDVNVKMLGVAVNGIKKGVVLSSYNGG